MASELEIKVRKLDNENETIYKSAKRIATILNKNYQTVQPIIFAKRKGFSNSKSFILSTLQIRGYINLAEYSNFQHHKRKGNFNNLRDFQERGGLNEHLKYKNMFFLDSLASSYDSSSPFLALETEEENEKISLTLKGIVKKLSPRHKYVIKQRFYQGKTLEEIGKKLKITREAVRQTEERALEKLNYLARQNSLDGSFIS